MEFITKLYGSVFGLNNKKILFASKSILGCKIRDNSRAKINKPYFRKYLTGLIEITSPYTKKAEGKSEEIAQYRVMKWKRKKLVILV